MSDQDSKDHMPRAGQWVEVNGEIPREVPDQGLRYNTNKPALHYCLYGRAVIEGEARVWQVGAKKYSEGNWLKGMSITESVDSLQRHVAALLAGENNDPETGLPHVDHIVCCAKILSNSFHERPDLDDRPGKAKGDAKTNTDTGQRDTYFWPGQS